MCLMPNNSRRYHTEVAASHRSLLNWVDLCINPLQVKVWRAIDNRDSRFISAQVASSYVLAYRHRRLKA